MESIQVKDGQNIIDIALQYYGSAEAVFDLAFDNNLSLSEALAPGRILIIDPVKIVRNDIVQYYKNNNIIIATGNEAEAAVTGDFGVEFNEDFGSEYN